MSALPPFLVKESKVVSFVISMVFLAMFISAIGYLLANPNDNRMDIKLASLTIIPSIYYFQKAFRNKTVMVVNHEGIFYQGKLLTNWTNFISAHYTQEEKLMSIQDNFILLVDYYKPESGKRFTTKIGLPSILNKSEEDIIAAIKTFSASHESGKTNFQF